MNQTTYKSILYIQSFHNYFNDGILSGLEFVPAASLRPVFGQLGIFFKETTNGFRLFAPTEVAVASLLAEIQNTHGITAFDFDIKETNDPFFINYTDLPLNRNPLLVFSSADPKNETIGDQTVLHPSFHEKENASLLGQLHIAFDDMLALLTNDAPVPFAISLKARATQWNYYFVFGNSQPLDVLRIFSDTGIQFSAPVDAFIANGKKAHLMTSNVLIPLSEYSKHNFELKFDGNTINLPTASAHLIEIVENDGAKWATSPIYVHI